MYQLFRRVSERLKGFKEDFSGRESVYNRQSSDSHVYQKHTEKQKTLEERKIEQLERQRAIAQENIETEAARKRQLAAWKKDVEKSFK